MKKLTLLIVATALLACNRAPQFSVEGHIANAEGALLYLECVTDSAITTLDSLTLPADGKYAFRAPQPPFPEFYRLRLGKQSILFAIDSCENIGIDGQKEKFATEYSVTNSETSCKIKQLRNSGFAIQQNINAGNTAQADLAAQIETHKQAARQIILDNTRSLAAYYAVNQMVNGFFLFAPTNKNDRSYWSAVATAYKVFQPNNPRTQLIENKVLNAINAARTTQPEVGLIGLIDIELPNRLGQKTTLSSLAGNVILVDFSAYALENAPLHTLFLRDLYTTYHAKGFEIFQISLDDSKLFWLEQTKEIPWVCVRDNNAPNCHYLLTYNVETIPAYYLIDRDGNIVAGKDLDTNNLEQTIARLLE